MVVRGGRRAAKTPPVLSHEFIIQNHADIVSCVMVVFVVGMVVPLTSSICSCFVALQYIMDTATRVYLYGTGLKDICTIFFYSLVCIVLHAVQQEYVLDKLGKKLHLSKIKTSMFNESGQLLVFYILSVVWAADIIIKEDLLLNLRSTWENYPHLTMPFLMKFFYIVQIAYYLHCFPQLYFSKVKRDEIPNKVQFAAIRLLFLAAAYILNFNRVGVLLLFLHYLSESFYHGARLFDIIDKEEKNSKVGFMVSNIVFTLSRVGTVILSLVTFLVGLSYTSETGEGNYNSKTVRFSAFGLIMALQIALLYNFLKDHVHELKGFRLPIGRVLKSSKKNNVKFSQKKKNRRGDDNDLTEADQNLKRTIQAHNKGKKVK